MGRGWVLAGPRGRRAVSPLCGRPRAAPNHQGMGSQSSRRQDPRIGTQALPEAQVLPIQTSKLQHPQACRTQRCPRGRWMSRSVLTRRAGGRAA